MRLLVGPTSNFRPAQGENTRTQTCLVAAPEMAEADVLIAPAVHVPRMSATDEQERAVQAGYEAARAALPRITRGIRPRADAES